MADEPTALATPQDATAEAVAALPDELFGDAGEDHGGWPALGEVAPAPETPPAGAQASGEGDGTPSGEPSGEPAAAGPGDGAPSATGPEAGTGDGAAPAGEPVPGEPQPAEPAAPAPAPELDAFAQALPEDRRALYLGMDEPTRAFVRAQVEQADPYRNVRQQYADVTGGQTTEESAREYASLLAIKRSFLSDPRGLVRRLLAQHNLPPEAALPGWEAGQPAAAPGQQPAAAPGQPAADPLAEIRTLLANEDTATEMGTQGVAVANMLLERIEQLQQDAAIQSQAIQGQQSMAEQHRLHQAETGWDSFAGRQNEDGTRRNVHIDNPAVRRRMQILAQDHPVVRAGGVPDADVLQEIYDDSVGSNRDLRTEMIQSLAGTMPPAPQPAAPAAPAAAPAAPAPAAPQRVAPRAGQPPNNPGAAGGGGEDSIELDNGMTVPRRLFGKTEDMIGHLLDQTRGRVQ